MYRRFQDRFGTAGVIVAVVALIAALSGTALAASGALTGKQKKEVEKIAKKYAGTPGAPGAAGANGTNGTNGKDGTNGSPGAPGTSATAVAFTGSKGTCTKGQGGIEVKSASATTFVCNGEEGEEGEQGESPFGTPFAGNAEPTDNPCAGAGGVTYTVEGTGSPVCNGKEGSPWTAGGTLPPGAVETGSWVMEGTAADTSGVDVSLSFPIPLASAIEGRTFVHFRTDANFDSVCPGNSEIPTVSPGELCVYTTGFEPPFPGLDGISSASFPEEGAGPQGAILEFSPPTEAIKSFGTFAVMGCAKATVAVPNPPFKCP